MAHPQFTFVLSFNYALNASLQVGDNVYYNTLSQAGGFSQNGATSTIHLGEILDVQHSPASIVVLSSNVDTFGDPCVTGYNGCTSTAIPAAGSYISFSKNNIVNNNDLTGYYASVNLINNSKLKAELFSLGSEVVESSK